MYGLFSEECYDHAQVLTKDLNITVEDILQELASDDIDVTNASDKDTMIAKMRTFVPAIKKVFQ